MKDHELKELLMQAFHQGRAGMAESATPGAHQTSRPAPRIHGNRTFSLRTWLLSATAMLAVMVLSLGGFQAWRSYTIHQMALEETVRYLEDLMDRT